ncbi:unnamed protein product [Rodentolepis nana]|uniref:C2H2-type domain-containing protein n=1 Tax=Rodentolepis nana TaxID=102285 RepID=A0A0R3TX29_RODNA|nr:unnamed protein product [Rodentolepis nana]
MSSTAGTDLLDVQQAYMAHFYNLFETFIKNPLCATPAHSHKDPPIFSKPNDDALTKDAFDCRLCKGVYENPMQLAQHNCPQLTRRAFQCHNCQKAFNCSANLASHQRWHRPKSATLASKRAPSQIKPDTVEPSTGLDLSTHSSSTASSSDNQSVKAPRKIIRSPCEQRSHTQRTTSFSIDSILETPKSTFPCFRCDETLHSQSDFEDHIIDHMLCTQEK